MDKLIEIKTVEEFEKAKAGKTIFMFTANWCPDCMFVKPFIGDIVDANPEFKFYVVNRDDLLDLCKSLDPRGAAGGWQRCADQPFPLPGL